MPLSRILPLLLALAGSSCSRTGESAIQAQLDKGTGIVRLPPGTTELTRELRLPPEAHDLEIIGESTTVLRATRDFQGRAMLDLGGARNVTIRGIQFDGNRAENDRRIDRPFAGVPYSQHFGASGILAVKAAAIRISGIYFR